MHVGHGRGAVFGDALANLLAFTGSKVTREYYINDAGAQVDVLARSAFLRYREALGEDIGEIPEGLYPGDYLVSVGRTLAERYGSSLLHKPESDWRPIVRDAAIDAMMAMIRDDQDDDRKHRHEATDPRTVRARGAKDRYEVGTVLDSVEIGPELSVVPHGDAVSRETRS
jgi:arginyl-tRNA synthetase